jgi:hypothetical protein
MKKPGSMRGLEQLGRARLSPSFFMRDMLYSEIANFYEMPNIPDYPDVAIEAGRRLCQDLLEPLQDAFGRISIRSAYRSPSVNEFGARNGLNCASNKANFAAHIWDYRDEKGRLGATACVVVNSYIDYYETTGDWQALAWWIHDNLPYNRMTFYPKLAAFNINWCEDPERQIYSQIPPHKGCLTKPGYENHSGSLSRCR